MLAIVKVVAVFLLGFFLFPPSPSEHPRRLELLFLGHNSEHHNSGQLADIMSREYFKSGINISYTTNPDDLNEELLSKYDGLILYANYDSITTSQEKALLNFVQGGKAFIPLHCASYCFRNSPEVVEMIGGQFLKHGYDSFPSIITVKDHPVTQGINEFYTKDESYVHDKISKKNYCTHGTPLLSFRNRKYGDCATTIPPLEKVKLVGILSLSANNVNLSALPSPSVSSRMRILSSPCSLSSFTVFG